MSLPRSLRQIMPALALPMVLCASPALACLNDTAATRAEQEFRSRYESPQPGAPAPSRFSIWGAGALSIGTGLIAGCFAVAVQRKRRGGR